MRYMVFVKMAEDVGEPPAALVDAMGREMSQAFAEGWMVDAGGLYPSAQRTEIRMSGGSITATDGPFAEAKEVVGGYSVIEVGSDEEAVEKARRVVELHQEHWRGWEGSVELSRISGPDEGPPQGS
jgi:hypothetical protein